MRMRCTQNNILWSERWRRIQIRTSLKTTWITKFLTKEFLWHLVRLNHKLATWKIMTKNLHHKRNSKKPPIPKLDQLPRPSLVPPGKMSTPKTSLRTSTQEDKAFTSQSLPSTEVLNTRSPKSTSKSLKSFDLTSTRQSPLRSKGVPDARAAQEDDHSLSRGTKVTLKAMDRSTMMKRKSIKGITLHSKT